MAAGTYNFTIEQGATFSRLLTLKENDSVMNLTGYSAASQMRQSHDTSTVAGTITCTISDASNGQITLSMTSTATGNIEEGIYVYDIQGNKYIEGLAGLWCNALGFGNESLVETAANQMQKFGYGSLFASKSHEPAIMLSEKLIEMSPYQDGKVFFGNSGSDANDTQYKLFTYLNNALGKPKKKKFLARKKGYHGITVASGSMTGIPANHKLFDLPLPNFFHTDTPHFYREKLPNETEEDFVIRITNNLEELINKEGSDSFMAMIAEPLIGAGGVLIPPKNYFPSIQNVLDKYDIPLIDDEVVCGLSLIHI